MRKLCISLSKGGVGKSTTAVNLAAGLAAAGRRVLLIDTDTQGQAGAMLGATPAAGLAELVAGEVTAAAAVSNVRPGLDLLAGGRALAGVKRIIARKDFGGEHVLSEALRPLELPQDEREPPGGPGPYDFVLIDTAPGWDALTVNVLFYAEEVVAPVSLEALTLHGLAEFTRTVESIQQYNERLRLRYVVPTFLDGRVKKSAEVLRQLEAYCRAAPDGPELCPPIRYNVRVSEAPAFGESIFEYAPGSSGAEDYGRLVSTVLGSAN